MSVQFLPYIIYFVYSALWSVTGIYQSLNIYIVIYPLTDGCSVGDGMTAGANCQCFGALIGSGS